VGLPSLLLVVGRSIYRHKYSKDANFCEFILDYFGRKSVRNRADKIGPGLPTQADGFGALDGNFGVRFSQYQRNLKLFFETFGYPLWNYLKKAARNVY